MAKHQSKLVRYWNEWSLERGALVLIRAILAVRIRPPLQPSDPGYDLIPQRYQRSMVHTSTSTGLTVESPQGKKFFIFDKVFGETTQQEGIWEYVRDSVDSFMQGYNVSILAYGQSGSGKSYTMGTSAGGEQSNYQQMGMHIFLLCPDHGRISLPGLSNHCDLIGVIPRAASVLFQKLQPPSLKRSGSSGSGLRTPTRYSMHGTQGLASMAKAQSQPDKNWQIKATYVEVRNLSRALRLASNLSRSTMSNFAIYSSQRMPRPRNEGQ